MSQICRKNTEEEDIYKRIISIVLIVISILSALGCQLTDGKESKVIAKNVHKVHSVMKNNIDKEVVKVEEKINAEMGHDTEQTPVEKPISSEPVIEDEESIPVEETFAEENYVEPAPEEPQSFEPSNVGGYAGTYEITAYTWTGNPMANGEYPYYGCVASCDFPLGTVLNIEGVGIFVVNDVCPTSGVIDVYMDSYDACISFGRMSANVYIQ